MSTLTFEQSQQYEAMRLIKDRVSAEFLQRPGVRGIGVGFKEIGGQQINQLAIRFYVTHKYECPEQEKLPTEIEGIPTDVIELDFKLAILTQPVREGEPVLECNTNPEDDPNKYDPLVGGISIGPSRSFEENGQDFYGVGTLGVMVRDRNSGDPLMLSNRHVMYGTDGGGHTGDTLCQPSRVDQWLQYCSNCAKTERSRGENVSFNGLEYGIDCAVAKLTHRTANIGKIVDIPNVVNTTATAKVGEKVIKRGRTTGKTEGTIDDIAYEGPFDFGPPHGKVILKNLILIKPNSGSFLEGGDSGSILINKDSNDAVGLCFATSDNHPGYGVANSIEAVMEALNISF
jgi:hypothetical protein